MKLGLTLFWFCNFQPSSIVDCAGEQTVHYLDSRKLHGEHGCYKNFSINLGTSVIGVSICILVRT